MIVGEHKIPLTFSMIEGILNSTAKQCWSCNKEFSNGDTVQVENLELDVLNGRYYATGVPLVRHHGCAGKER